MDENDILLIAVTIVLLYYVDSRFDRPPLHRNRLRGEQLIQEWLQQPLLLYRATGLQLITFLNLVHWIRTETELDNTRNMTLEERVAIFLYICRHGSGHDNAEDTFGRAADTVSRFIYSS